MDLLTQTSNYERSRGSVPELPIVNFFAESIPSEGRVVLQSRPGLAVSSTIASGPIRQIYSEPNVFNEDTFVAIGNKIYRNGVLIGTIDGTDRVSFAAYAGMLFIAAGGSLWVYNGSTFTTVALPDGFSPLKIVVGASRLIVLSKNTQRIYWSNVLSSTIDALSFAEAESSPDLLLDMVFMGDNLILFGQESIEFWAISSDPNIPFEPTIGRVYARGIKTTGATARLINSAAFAWISDTDQICLNDPSRIISDSELEIRISTSTNPLLWSFTLDQTEYLAATLDRETWILSMAEGGQWSRFESYGLSNWEPCCFSNGYFGSAFSGRLLTWSTDHVDADQTQMNRTFRVWAPLSTETVIVNNVTLAIDGGSTPFLSGTYSEPSIEMRVSKDGGETFSSWRASTTGGRGKFRKAPKWLSNGIFSYPGIMLEFRMSSPTPLRVSHVYVNEKYGGY